MSKAAAEALVRLAWRPVLWCTRHGNLWLASLVSARADEYTDNAVRSCCTRAGGRGSTDIAAFVG